MLGSYRPSVNPRVWIWGGLLAALALALQAVPLLDVLGYDYAFALGLLTAFAAVDVGHGEGRRATATAPLAASGVFRATARALVTALALLLAPLLISTANAVRVPNCSFSAGLAFFALLPAATAVYAASFGTALGLLAPDRRGRALALAAPVVSVVWGLLRLYREPAVFAMDPFAGYFPGPIYDEALRPPLSLVTFRAANLVWAAALLSGVAVWLRPTRRARALSALLGAAGLVLFALGGRLGWRQSHADLQRLLSRVARSEHFIVYSDAHDGRSLAERALRLDDLEFRYDQLHRIFEVEPSQPVTVFDFPSAEAKKAAVGAGSTLFAKPWAREIFVQLEGFPSRRLRHELAHVFAASFGDRWFGVALRWRPWPRLASGLIEGVAEAADFTDPDGRSTLHEEAAALIADGRAAPLATVVGAGFTTLSGPRAYTLAGSFCRWLLDTRGAARLRALYASGGDFAAVYGTPLPLLETHWRAFLATQAVDQRARNAAAERFRRPAIFKKVCARELAARVDEAQHLVDDDPAQALALMQRTCADDPQEPSYRMTLAQMQAGVGLRDEASRAAAALARDPQLTTPERARALDLEATLAFHAGRWAVAAERLTAVDDLSADDGARRTARAKLRALADDDARATLGRVLFGDRPGHFPDAALTMFLLTQFAHGAPEDALGPYLIGRQLAARDARAALGQLTAACPRAGSAAPERPLDDLFQRECARLTSEVALRAGELDVADDAGRWLEAHAETRAEALRARDAFERVAWTRARAAQP